MSSRVTAFMVSMRVFGASSRRIASLAAGLTLGPVLGSLLGPLLGLGFSLNSTAALADPSHGISVFGDLKYPADFEHFEYASPEAVKGGSVTLSSLGTFDNLNPFILKGVSAAGAAGVFDTLMSTAQDESSSMYGLVAESIDVAEDGQSVTFRLRPEARFHDGHAIDAEDVVWTFDTLMSEGHPLYRNYYASVSGAEAIDEHTVTFSFTEADNAELPLSVGQLPVLPAHAWEGEEFGSTTLDPLLGSGPYRVAKVDPGRSISYERVEDYWGKDLPVKVGHDNFDSLSYDYYRDLTVALEALKAGDVDFRREYISKSWATAYDFPALNEGRVVQEEIPDDSIQVFQAFLFNLRKPKYQDIRVREALTWTFDFEWANENFFFGAYQRLLSNFQGSELAATDLPQGRELEILEPFRDQLPESVFTEAFSLPVTDGSGNVRRELREAIKLFKEAGYAVQNGVMTNVETGEVFTMEMIIRQPSVEKIGLAWKKVLERLGIDLKVRVIDPAQYEKRMEDYDFDVTTHLWQQPESPGNEQYDYWHSRVADEPGSGNVAGIKDDVVDAIIPMIVSAKSREEQVAATRALDRVLMHEHYMLPHYFGPTYRLAFANKFSRPEIKPKKILGFSTWWVDPEKEEALGD